VFQWEFNDTRMLLGSDLVIFNGEETAAGGAAAGRAAHGAPPRGGGVVKDKKTGS
jgi:hypothetical protein